MGEIYNLTHPYSFNKLELITPTNKGGNYYIKMGLADGAQMSPIYIQPPKCYLKQGFFKTGKKMYCDLVFSQENEKFIQWLETLEQTCCARIFEHRAKWFENDLEEHEIENYMTSPYKIYKSGKLYVIRALIPTLMEACDLKIYDENEHEIAHTDLKENMDVIVILEFKGIKCAVRSFQFDIEVKQMLVLAPQKLFNKCIINVSSPPPSVSHSGGDEYTKPSVAISAQSAEPIPFLPKTQNENGHISGDNDTNIDNKGENRSLSQNENGHERPDLEKNADEGGNIIPDLEEAKNTIQNMSATNADGNMIEVDFTLDDLENAPVIHLKERNDVYYKMYKDAKKKAKEAKMLALSNYLEAKRIKTTYLLDDEDSEDSDFEDFLPQPHI